MIASGVSDRKDVFVMQMMYFVLPQALTVEVLTTEARGGTISPVTEQTWTKRLKSPRSISFFSTFSNKAFNLRCVKFFRDNYLKGQMEFNCVHLRVSWFTAKPKTAPNQEPRAIFPGSYWLSTTKHCFQKFNRVSSEKEQQHV